MKYIYLLFFLSFTALYSLAQPADENYDDDAGQNFTGNTFTLDGIKYTITGTETYSCSIENISAFAPLSSSAGDYYMYFDRDDFFGVSSIKIEAANGAAFRLAGISFHAIADAALTITPNGGLPVTYNSNGAYVTSQNIDLSANTAFSNITSFTMAGVNMSLFIDDLDFEAAVILPVTLQNFSARLAGNKTQLNWQISNEINVEKYSVETSLDGSHWQSLDGIKPANVPGSKSYTYTHNDPVSGNNFYRLKMQDIDGKYTYSNVLRIRFGQLISTSIYPNPAKDNLIVTLPGTQTGTLHIINTAGNIVMKKILQGNAVSIDIRRLPPGIYSLKILQGNNSYIEKLIKQ